MSKYAVWGMCYDPEWLRENDGTPDMMVAPPTEQSVAEERARHLSLLAPAAVIEVRDTLGTVVNTYGPERRERARPVPASHRGRRTLGGRGR